MPQGNSDDLKNSDMADINYYPQFGIVLSNGKLLVKTSGRSVEGELWDGCIEVGPEHPNYEEWLKAFNNKEQYFAEQRDADMRALEQRRAASKEKQAQLAKPLKDV